ncbi:MAG: hypothetical protein WD844_01090 [Thermoleophilaceae bacterium]
MDQKLEVRPTGKTLLVFDGEVLEAFAGGASSRIHAKGIEGVEVKDGRGSGIRIAYRFGPDLGISCDRERVAELQRFADHVLAAARRLQGA